MPEPRGAGLILGAGIGRRLGLGPKAFLTVDGVLLVDRAVALMRRALITDLVAVLPKGYEARWAPGDVTTVVNPDPDSGPCASVSLGLEALEAHGPVDRLMVFPVDHPGVEFTDVQRVWEGAAEPVEGDSRIVPSWRERGGHPIVITARGLSAIRDLSDPAGRSLREVLAKAGNARYLSASGPGVLRNWNTPQDRTVDS